MQSIEISVIVPVYGVEKYMDRFMKSVCNQTMSNFRVIIVNDRTNDNSVEIIYTYAEKLGNRLVVIENEQNLGLSMSRNRGLDYVSDNPTKYVTFLDPDDWIDEDYFEDLYVTSENYDLDLCISGLVRILEEDQKVICCELTTMPSKVFESAEACKQLAFINPCAYSKLYRFEPIKELRFRTIKRSEDTCYLFEALRVLNRVKFTNNARYHYCLRSTSLTGNLDEEKYESMHRGFAEVLSCYDNNDLKEQFIAQIYIRSSLGGVCRLCFNDLKRARSMEKRELRYLDTYISGWRQNRFLKIGKNGIGGKKELALKLTALMYKAHIFFVFIWIYYFVVKVLKIDVRA